jgi:hypothetical protein
LGCRGSGYEWLDSRSLEKEPTVVRIEPELSRSTFDENYWLGNCEGFRVEARGRKIGTVEHVVFSGDRPVQLSVCSGMLRLRSKLVPIDDVAVVWPRELTLRVRDVPKARPGALSAHTRRRVLHPLRG